MCEYDECVLPNKRGGVSQAGGGGRREGEGREGGRDDNHRILASHF